MFAYKCGNSAHGATSDGALIETATTIVRKERVK